jgi:hypothetical protein
MSYTININPTLSAEQQFSIIPRCTKSPVKSGLFYFYGLPSSMSISLVPRSNHKRLGKLVNGHHSPFAPEVIDKTDNN